MKWLNDQPWGGWVKSLENIPWVVVCLVGAFAAMGLVALLPYLSTTWQLLVGVGIIVFLGMLLLHPKRRYFRMFCSLFGFIIGGKLLPLFSFSYEGENWFVRYAQEGPGDNLLLGFIGLAIVLLVLDFLEQSEWPKRRKLNKEERESIQAPALFTAVSVAVVLVVVVLGGRAKRVTLLEARRAADKQKTTDARRRVSAYKRKNKNGIAVGFCRMPGSDNGKSDQGEAQLDDNCYLEINVIFRAAAVDNVVAAKLVRLNVDDVKSHDRAEELREAMGADLLIWGAFSYKQKARRFNVNFTTKEKIPAVPLLYRRVQRANVDTFQDIAESDTIGLSVCVTALILQGRKHLELCEALLEELVKASRWRAFSPRTQAYIGFIKGNFHYMRNELPLAIRIYQKAAASGEAAGQISVPLYFNLARALMQLGQAAGKASLIVEAVETYRKCIKGLPESDYPDDPYVYQAIGVAQSVLVDAYAHQNKELTDELREEALGHLGRSNALFEASGKKIKAAERQEQVSDNFYHIGLLHRTAKAYEQAKRAFSRALEIKPENYHAHYGMGQLALDCYRAAEGESLSAAEGHFERAIKHASTAEPRFIDGHIGRAIVLKIRGQLEEALKILAVAIKTNDSNPQAYLVQGDVQQVLYQQALSGVETAQERWRGAAFSSYSKVLKLNSDHAAAYWLRGQVQHLDQKYSEAIRDYTQALKRKIQLTKEQNAELLWFRGRAYMGTENEQQAEKDLLEAEKLIDELELAEELAEGSSLKERIAAALEELREQKK